MKKGTLRLTMLVLFAGLIFLSVGVLTAANVPDEVMIDNKVYKSDKKGPVKFSHKKHAVDYKAKCSDCHHDYKDGKNVWKDTDPVKKCGDCHDANEKKGNVDKLMNAFHKNCQGCHKELKGKEAPSKKCNDCHQGK
ncbi:MAG: cytochrome c3 family protein [Deltaproteobacteria bacterium]|nr:cytochrome c3 family protein [Deltaproteobacteria bacterium]